MTLANLPGGFAIPVGPSLFASSVNSASLTNATSFLDAANDAVIMIGQIKTADGASHTIDTTGSSRLEWLTGGSFTFANAGTSVRVGLAAVDLSNGPPARAVNVANAITFDVYRDIVGGSGGITASAWQTHVPTAGTKTIADGDLVAFAIQMVTRAGADQILVNLTSSSGGGNMPQVTEIIAGTPTNVTLGYPDAIIVFSDGTLGWFFGSIVQAGTGFRTFASNSTPNEAGVLYQFPFPVRVHGAWGLIDADFDFDLVLYSDPLGTPVAQKTLSVDANTMSGTTSKRQQHMFATPYDVPANTPFALIVKPTTTSSISIYYRTLANAAHRVSDPWGTNGYGVTRSGGSGAFANQNSSLDHYYLGLMLGGFDAGGGGGLIVNQGLRGGF